MSTTLGLDIGTNSIGWCLTEDNKSIIDLGVRIFPVGVNENELGKGKEVSRNVERRNARHARRLNFRYKLRRDKLKAILQDLKMLPDESLIQIPSKELYGLRKKALDEKIDLEEIGRIFLLLNQRRGFKSSRKSGNDEDKETQGIKKEMSELAQTVNESNCRTIGEYFYSLFEENESGVNPDEPLERIRKRFVYRSMYVEEFDLIWDKQKSYYPDIFTEENKKRIKDECIYYQRKLKSVKHLVGKCPFEKGKKAAPRSSILFQEFRMWQIINSIRITNDDRTKEPLTLDEKNILADKLNNTKEMKHSSIKTLLNLSKNTSFNDIPEPVKGIATKAALIKALGEDYYNSLNDDHIYKLWHTLMYAEDEDWLVEYAHSKLGLNEEQTENYLKISLEEGYGRISTKALKNIVPFLKEGYEYSEACERAGYKHSDQYNSDRPLQDKITTDLNELKNPIVQKSINETIKLVNAIIKEYGRPDTIRVEMARELKKSKADREAIFKANNKKRELRDSYREFLKRNFNMNPSTADLLKFELWLEMEFAQTELEKLNGNFNIEDFKKFAKNVNPTDKLKFELWLECGRISPYTGKVIPLYKLFSAEYEIEHIAPYSKSMDNSFINKTISEREFNKEKGNRLPYEYFKNRPAELAAFKQRAKHFPKAKFDRLMMKEIPDDFIASQMNNTSYVGRELLKILRTAAPKVHVTNGQATGILRSKWGLNEILNPEKNEKLRDDHRHHIIDAAVVAYTTPGTLHNLSSRATFNYWGKLSIRDFKMPYDDFKKELEEKLSTVFTSFNNKKRLISTRKNKYIHKKTKTVQKTYCIRGALHKETFYGKINNPHTDSEVFVFRKDVENLTKGEIDRIIDPRNKKIILEHIEKHGSLAKALKEPITVKTAGGKEIPFKKVRIAARSEPVKVQTNADESPYAESGSNYRIIVYENNEGKRRYKNLSFFDAAVKAVNGLPVIPKAEPGFFPVLNVTHNELVVVYDKHRDEIEWDNRQHLFDRLYKVIKFIKDGRIYLGKHNYSNIKADKDKTPIVLCKNYNTLNAVKVKLTTLGKLVRDD